MVIIQHYYIIAPLTTWIPCYQFNFILLALFFSHFIQSKGFHNVRNKDIVTFRFNSLYISLIINLGRNFVL